MWQQFEFDGYRLCMPRVRFPMNCNESDESILFSKLHAVCKILWVNCVLDVQNLNYNFCQ